MFVFTNFIFHKCIHPYDLCIYYNFLYIRLRTVHICKYYYVVYCKVRSKCSSNVKITSLLLDFWPKITKSQRITGLRVCWEVRDVDGYIDE